MKVGIIGSGNVGKALAGAAVTAGHSVKITATTPGKADEAAKATGAEAVRSNQEAVRDSDLVVLAVPAGKVDDVVAALGPELDGKVIIDVTNRVDTQNPGNVLDGSSNAERIQRRVPKAHVVKALNYTFSSRHANPSIGGTRLDGFVAGDDEGAKKKALSFVESIGFRPIDAGPLVMSRVLEGMASLIISLQIKHKWPWQNGWKLVGPPHDSGQSAPRS